MMATRPPGTIASRSDSGSGRSSRRPSDAGRTCADTGRPRAAPQEVTAYQLGVIVSDVGLHGRGDVGSVEGDPDPTAFLRKVSNSAPGLHITGAGIQRGLELFVQRYAQPFGESGATLSDADWNRLANDSLPPNLSLLNARIVGGPRAERFLQVSYRPGPPACSVCDKRFGNHQRRAHRRAERLIASASFVVQLIKDITRYT